MTALAAPAAGSRRRPWRAALCVLTATLYFVAGGFHLLDPAPFVRITPGWVPLPAEVVLWTGIAEIAGALALLQPWSRPLRQAAGFAFALYAVCVFPANINHMLIDLALPRPELGIAYHAPRMVVQPLLVWLALWVGEVIEWPFAPKHRGSRR